MKLAGKVAVVTGGARGIGRAIVERYVAEGATVAVADRLVGDAEGLAAGLGGQAFAVGLDVTDRASIDAMVAAVVERTGGIDVLVNNAGVFDMGPVVEVSEESWDRQFAVNTKGLFFTLQAVARQMIAQKAAAEADGTAGPGGGPGGGSAGGAGPDRASRSGGEGLPADGARPRGGKIINVSSQAGRRGEGLVSVYCASKAAVISLTQSCGLDLIRHGINVNGIAPGVVDTPMWDHVDSLFAKYEGRPIGEKKRLVGAAVPYGRMGRPEDHAGAAVFLASADADYVVAQTLNVDGGNWMS